MSYKLLKPEAISTRKILWDTLKVRKVFWGILSFAVVASVVLAVLINLVGVISSDLVLIPFSVVLSYVVVVYVQIVRDINISFWKRFADINVWKYSNSSDSDKETGVMFRNVQSKEISHYIEGVIDDRKFRIFNYYFTIGSGKNQKAYYYTVFAFKFNGSFPHIYLNNKHNPYSIKTGEKVPLPSEFEKQFSLLAPRKYEIEALEIFTPDILVKILDSGFSYDVELVDNEVIVFVDGYIHSIEKLEKEFNKALELENLLDEKLDKFKFHPIGDMSHQLK